VQCRLARFPGFAVRQALQLSIPATSHFPLGLGPSRALPYPPVRFGYGNKAGSPGHPARGSCSVKGARCQVLARGQGHVPPLTTPLLVPDITFSDPEQGTRGRWTSSSPTRKGRRRAKGLQESRPFTRSRGSRPSTARRAQRRAATALLPIAIETFGGLGPARRASSRPFCDSDRRASPTSTATTTMRRGSGTTTHSASW